MNRYTVVLTVVAACLLQALAHAHPMGKPPKSNVQPRAAGNLVWATQYDLESGGRTAVRVHMWAISGLWDARWQATVAGEPGSLGQFIQGTGSCHQACEPTWVAPENTGTEPVTYQIAYESKSASDAEWEVEGEIDVRVHPVARQQFSDVDSDHWAFDAIDFCHLAGYIVGYPDGTYKPDDPITRDQMAVYIARAVQGATTPIGLE